jgi:hypothetical protein
MKIDDYEFMADGVTKFYNTLRVYGWFHHPTDQLATVEILYDNHLAVTASVGFDHGGVLDSLGKAKGFSIQTLRPNNDFNEDAALKFTTGAGWTATVKLTDLCKDRNAIPLRPASVMMNKFLDLMNVEGTRILDIGGRSRSKIDLSAMFGKSQCTVLDILPGDNVDVVGDAHAMATFFPPEHFDGIYSVSVFEHLLMPWAVVPQMNKILKPGGLALIFSHQTLGIHDPPWDFWRFSDTAWDALFNPRTGFEILERAMDFEQYILPHIWRPNKPHEERATGFEGSVVLIRKTGLCQMSWPLTPADLIATSYPES